jgi:hypothetical protein
MRGATTAPAAGGKSGATVLIAFDNDADGLLRA